METLVGSLVESIRGNDKGKQYFVIKIDKNRVFLVDGSKRTRKKPKIKNIKHINLIKYCNLDFKNLYDCDIIYKLKCFGSVSKNKSGGQF